MDAGKPPMRFEANYFGFDATHVLEIDEILARIAEAGYVFHHTRSWSEPAAEDGGPSYADLIQEAAKTAADTIERLQKENDRLKKQISKTPVAVYHGADRIWPDK